ncbi:MAG: chromosomal replication initiator protein DnaA [Spirochaetia bacterium]|nr:chromosomal replication initiator protein DnaA [Spirochaetia bacterium]
MLQNSHKNYTITGKQILTRENSEENTKNYWYTITEKLRKKIPSQFFSVFFSEIQEVTIENNQLILAAKDKRVINHIKKRYLNEIKEAAQEIISDNIDIIFDTDYTNQKTNENQKKKYKFSNLENNDNLSDRAKKHQANSAYPKYIALNPNYTFERFIKGPSNEHALVAAEEAAKTPKNFHNPLYLFGGVGLGKTHLLMAIGNYISEHLPYLNVQYIPAEIFQSDLIEAMISKSLPHFREKYRNVDVLMFDDIQFIKQRAEYTQEEIFHTFNYLYQNKKQIIISADRPPQHLSHLTDRLLNRFQSGLMVDIKPPNLETRMAILKKKSDELNLDISEEVRSYISMRIKTHIRGLEAALIKLKFVSDIERKPIDLKLAKHILKDLPNENSSHEVSIDEIFKILLKTYHVDEDEIKSSSRVERVALTRHVGMYLTKKLLPTMSLSSIAAVFGRTDHTTVIHADKKIHELINNDESFNIQINELLEELQF